MTNEERSSKVYKILNDMLINPRIGEGIIDIYLYKEQRRRRKNMDSMSILDNGRYTIKEVNPTGYIGLKKDNDMTLRKVLIKPRLVSNFKEGDMIHCQLAKKIFFQYWELERLKKYICSEVDTND